MTDQEAKIWKEGYEAGAKMVLNQNDKEIKIGKAIMEVLDERYEFKQEDY
jgi:hypothetical protein